MVSFESNFSEPPNTHKMYLVKFSLEVCLIFVWGALFCFFGH